NQLNSRLSCSARGTSGGVPKGFSKSGFHAAFEPVHLPGSPPLVGEGPLRLGEMVHPFQQQHGDQRSPNLNQQRIPAGAHKTLHFQILFQGLEQLNDILPINNVPLKLRFTTATIPCVHRTCQWSGCTTFTTRSTMSCVAPMARRWPCRPGDRKSTRLNSS